MELLFTYGTLQLEEVQLATFGRRLEGKPDALPGYRLVMITITDEDFVIKSGLRTIATSSSPEIRRIPSKA